MNSPSKDPLLANTVIEILATIISGFVALTSVLGGILLSAGLENNNLSLTLLNRTPFQDFFIPGILLIAIVGSTSALSSIGFIFNLKNKTIFGFLAGASLTIWIIVEILLLNQPTPTIIEFVYLFSGICLFVLTYLNFQKKNNSIADSR